jgi:hypothetical protein
VSEPPTRASGIGSSAAQATLAIWRWGTFWPYAAVLILIVTGLAFVRPDLPPPGAADTEKGKEVHPTLDDLDREISTIQNHRAAKVRVVQAVIAGQLSLRQGAEQLLDLHSVNPYFRWEIFREAYSGGTDRERCCRQLLVFIQLELANDPDQLRLVMARLEAERH